ncbi:MAG: acyl-CoA dehydrogenase family protein [Halanaeroarchaeum sp.]
MELSDEQEAIKRTAREIAEEEIRPIAAEADREAAFPEGVWDTLADVGMTAMTVPEEYGGLDLQMRTYSIVNEEIAYGALAVATALGVHGLATSCIAAFGDDEIQEAWLPDMAEGRPVGAFALSEPEAGSNPAQMSTVARREGDEYVVDGEKQWITNGRRSDVVILFAKTDPDDPGSITQFLVPKDVDGLTVGDEEDKMGLRASDTTALSFDGVRIPERYRLTEEGRGLSAALQILTNGRIGIASQAVGLAQAAFDDAVEYAQEREQFGERIADFQALRHDAAEMQTNIAAARELTREAARLADAGEDYRHAAARAKLFATETAVDVTETAVQFHGGYGYTKDFDVERYYRDAKVTTIYEGTSEIQKDVIARGVFE